ncbi:xyloglucan O-acetyltransferase 4-like [Actinidia eriantha]|uniref:xyloglucan O-acetyltransferase 4-like n=1 Tax=Actinidia eriantha TaxID=165200 RepID=UPI0025909167|nr:xyloglucan O-acetyltransferase 4-like [Actinidia eriantha]
MKSPSLSSEKLQRIKEETRINMANLSPFLLSSLAVTSIFGFFILYSPNPFKFSPKHASNQQSTLFQHQNGDENCDLFKGQWVPDMNGSLYTNLDCQTIPDSKNCFKNGRRERDFVNWRWKPQQCELARFDPKTFLQIVKGKKMAFIGDSVARNHVESLLCLLSKEEVPRDIYKDSEDRFRTWHFPHYNFTLVILWSKFLVTGTERLINGSGTGVFDLQLDHVDPHWAEKLPGIDYAILSDAHWFFRKIYLFQGTNITGCVYCTEPNITDRGPGFALQMSFRTALHRINKCRECKGMVTFVRTFSPAHFENGTWDTGGRCNRTNPLDEDEIKLGAYELELRRIQLEETERARERGKRFETLDITRAMLMRPDGHPGAYWGNKWMKGYDDCVHWCLPGPIDVWNDLLLAMLKKEANLSLDEGYLLV